MSIKIPVPVKLAPGAQTPKQATDGSAGYDFFPKKGYQGVLIAGETLTIETGVSLEIPKGHALFLLSRSGHGFKKGVRLANCVGLIDSDYRGEIKVKLKSDAKPRPELVKFGLQYDDDIFFNEDIAIAQGVFIKCSEVDFINSDQLSETERGSGGFGHTDKDHGNG